MRQIKVFPQNSNEYKNLERIARRMTEESMKGFEYYVDWTWFDVGQGMKWTTIMGKDPDEWDDINTWQALYPVLHEKIVLGLVSDDEIMDEFYANKFNHDIRK